MSILHNMLASFSFPTTVLFGAGCTAQLPEQLEQLKCGNPLIVTDEGLLKTPAFAKLRRLLPMARIYSGVHSNPLEHDVDEAVCEYRAKGCDGVVAMGGGSAIDVGKIIRLPIARPEWHLREAPPTNIGHPLRPFIAIPTTAGTGSEVGRSSVVTIENEKRVIFHPKLLADRVILDPELTVDLPPKLTAATGADALTHCIESFTSPEFHPLCEGIALEGIHLISQSLRRAVSEPKDLDARGKMLIAATMGGIAFQKDLGAAHSLAHPLSALWHLHHGLANALVLPCVMRFNASRKPGLYVRVGEAMGLARPNDQQTIDAVESLLRDIGIEFGLSKHGVRSERLYLQALVFQAFCDPCHRTNAVPVTQQDLYDLYQQAM